MTKTWRFPAFKSRRQVQTSKYYSRFIQAILALPMFWIGVCDTRASDPVQISYHLDKSQRVSLNVYDSNGKIVRELLHGAAREEGNRTENWDGRDDAGKPLATGNYTWKMLSVPGFGAEFILSLGSNYTTDNSSPFWAQAAGCHGGPQAVVADQDGFYVGATTENIETAILKQSIDGSHRLWSNRAPAAWAGFSSLGLVGNTLFGFTGDKIYLYDKIKGTTGGKTIDAVYNTEGPSDMAVDETHVILSYPKAGLVRWLDYDGKETRKVVVPDARAVDVSSNGTAYVIAGNDMFRLVPGSVLAQPFISNMTDPQRAAINPANGEIYILLGAPANQVQRYSAEGKLLQTYGKAGGRVNGEYQSQRESFLGSRDIAVTTNGNFWVAECNSAPRRTAEFGQDGSWIQEWYGGQVWAPWVTPEPDNPRYVWMASNWNDFMRLEVDYAAKKWKVNACFSYSTFAGGLISGHSVSEIWVARSHKGTVYLCRENPGSYPVVLKFDRHKLTLAPAVIAAGNIWHEWATYPQWFQGKVGGPEGSSIWTDANGDGSPLNADGTIEDSEMTVFKDSAAYGTNSYVDDDLNYLTAGGATKFAVTSWNSSGSPVYGTFPKGERATIDAVKTTGAYDDRWTCFNINDSQGNVWGAFNVDIAGWGNSKDSFLARWNPDGKLAWEVGRGGTMPGQLRALRRIFGVIKSDSGDSCIVAGPFSYEWPGEGVTPIYVFDQDGLYAGQLLGRPVNQGSTPNTKYGLGGEALAGRILRDARGDVYFYSHWINEARVYKISGWDDWQKAGGGVFLPSNYTAPDFIPEIVGPNAHGTGLRGSYFTSKDCSGKPDIVRVDAKMNIASAALGDYSVRWDGTITPRRTGWHSFWEAKGWHSAHALWVDGKDVSAIELNSAGWPIDQYSGSNHVIWLQAGKPYSIRMEYYRNYANASGNDGILLQWAEPETNGNFVTIPDSQFSPPPLALISNP